jgi:hypothetical protein
MKRIFFSVIILFLFSAINSQTSKAGILQDLEMPRQPSPSGNTEATLKSASRLFRDKDDLTSVILVIPRESVVNILAFEDEYLRVVYNGNEGYISARHAVFKKVPASSGSAVSPEERNEVRDDHNSEQVDNRATSRYEYLEGKYGPSLASRLSNGKIWKGMNSQLVKDSWGSPRKINRIINGNTTTEEWYYSSTWLYFRNSRLIDWGPAR